MIRAYLIISGLLRKLSWQVSLLGHWFFKLAIEREIAQTGSCDRCMN